MDSQVRCTQLFAAAASLSTDQLLLTQGNAIVVIDSEDSVRSQSDRSNKRRQRNSDDNVSI
jgi:hypothetical protein